MTGITKILFSLLFCGFSAVSFAQYIAVDDTYTADDLVRNVLINSPCANVLNTAASGDTFSPGAQSFGYFNAGTSSFPFAEGVVLSTARAKRSEGPNDNLIDEGLTSWIGDTDLEQALNISDTFNATVLEFQFMPLGDQVSFDYIFASEEYQGTAPCTYSDGFAFLLKPVGSSAPYQNLALVPNTNTPVLVTSVHPEIPNRCPAINESYFGGYNNSNAPINFNGQTVIMTAQANVIPNTMYHIKLVIADHENIRFDSAIFLDGGSFKVNVDLGGDRLLTTNNPICQGATHVLDATLPGTNTYKWFKNGATIPGATAATYTVSVADVYSVEVHLGTGGCIATGKVTIEYAPASTLTNTTLVQCDVDNDGMGLFNLNKADDLIKNGDPTLQAVNYYPNLLAAQNQDASQVIINPGAYLSAPRTIYASVANIYGCFGVASVQLQVSNNTVARFRDLERCDTDGNIDGYFEFNLREADPLILQGLPAGLVVEYYVSEDEALLQTNKLQDHFTNNIIYQMYVYARIVNGSDCYGIIPLHLFVNNNSPDDFEDKTIVLCEGGSIQLEVAQIFDSYSWSNGDSTYQTTVTQPGEYTITVSDANTCLAIKKFIVVLSEKPEITSVTIDHFNKNGSSVLINFSGNGNYEFSIDGEYFQTSPYFADVSPGEYTVWVKDKDGCGEESQVIQVLNYPSFFTPNDDGYNDVWKIDNLNLLSGTKINIFDRYGKLLYQINSRQPFWNGKYDSKELPADDYWFVIQMDNGKITKGHFTLKR